MIINKTFWIEIAINQWIAPINGDRIGYERIGDFFSNIARVRTILVGNRKFVLS